MQPSNIRIASACVLAATVLTAAGARAGTLVVSTNGVDSITCGATTPCKSIGQAVMNASDGDTLAVLPGNYAGATIDKPLSLYSSSGTGGAVITSVLDVTAAGTVIGKSGKGFAFGSSGLSVTIAADGVTVRGNEFSTGTTAIEVDSGTEAVIRDNSFNGMQIGIALVGGTAALIRENRFGHIQNAAVSLESGSSAATVRENRTFGPNGAAFSISGSSHFFYRNVVHGTPGGGFVTVGTPTDVVLTENLVTRSNSHAYYLTGGTGWTLNKNAAVNTNAAGYYLAGGSKYVLNGNIAIGSAAWGFLVIDGSDHVLVDNSAIDNVNDGILLSGIGTGVTVSGGNLYGNGAGNCGFTNSSASAVTVTDVYWGDPVGPSADPADQICGNTALVSASEPAFSQHKIKMPGIK